MNATCWSDRPFQRLTSFLLPPLLSALAAEQSYITSNFLCAPHIYDFCSSWDKKYPLCTTY